MRSKKLNKEAGLFLIALLPFLLIVTGFEILPALKLILESFKAADGFTLANYQKFFAGKFYLTSLKNSLSLSVTSSVLGVMAGAFAAYGLSNSSEKVKNMFLTFTSITVNFAGVPLAFAFIIVLGTSGIVSTFLANYFNYNLYDHFSLYGWFGLSLVYLYFQIPLSTLLIYPAFNGIKKEWIEAAANLGAPGWKFWWHIGLPVLAPALLGTFSILMANALGAYATAYALTTGIYNILPLRISRLIMGEVSYEPGLASSSAVILAVIMICFVLFNQYMAKAYRGDRS